MWEKYSLFPIRYPNLYSFYEKQRDAFWVPKEVDLEKDVVDWRENLTKEDHHFLIHTLAFFAQADGIVLDNLNSNFSLEVDLPEANIFFGIQAGIEAIHWEMYNILIETLIVDQKEKIKAFNAIENYPCIRKKAEWLKTWMDPKNSILMRLVAFACAEGIFFSSAFASIFYYKKKGLMPGLTLSNKFISRDEGLHRDFGCELFKVLLKTPQEPCALHNGSKVLIKEPCASLDTNFISEIVKEAVEIECQFVDESLNVQLIGINPSSMKEYVKFVADSLLSKLDSTTIYNVKNPFDWMDLISLSSKQNFFEGRVSEYKKNQSDMTFEISTDF